MSQSPPSVVLNSNAATIGDDNQPYNSKQSSPLNKNIDSTHIVNHIDNHINNNNNDENNDNISLISKLLVSLPENYSEELENDPNISDFIKFHKLIDESLPFKEEDNNNNNNNNNNKSLLKEIPKYDWEILSFAFDYIYKLYTEEINEILNNFDKLDIKRSIWQESAFRLDGERASKKFRSIESWIHDSDLYLNFMRDDLTSSVEIIRNTLNKLNSPIQNINNSNNKNYNFLETETP